jgi:hypothetical protein
MIDGATGEVEEGATMRPLSIRGLLAAAIALAVLGAATAGAEPRYAARYDNRCALCHDNPSGGGKRNLYAVQHLVPNELSGRHLSEEVRQTIQPQLGSNVSLGMDLRTLHHYADDRTQPQNFAEMQGDLYFTIRPEAHVTACLTRGMAGNYEVFGIAYLLPRSGYVKVGRFVTPYGWRLPDHSAFVRFYEGFMAPANSDVGVEVGTFPGRLELQASLTNGARGAISDTDRDLAFSGRALARQRLGQLKTAVGGSYAYSGSAGFPLLSAGPFGSFSWRRLTWLGEADWTRRRRFGDGNVWGIDMSHEVSFHAGPGLDLLATYDFHDPNTGRKTGALGRYGVGVDWFAIPFIQLRGMIDFYHVKRGPELPSPSKNYYQTEVQAHFLY